MQAFFEPLTDVEKFELEPEYFRPEKIIMRRMFSDGIRPDDTNLLAIAKVCVCVCVCVCDM